MFIILLDYKKPLETVDEYVSQHREFLQTGYDKDYLVASGPRTPRDGGVLISQLKDREIIENFLKDDPYYIHDIADYKVIEFTPVKYHKAFTQFIN